MADWTDRISSVVFTRIKNEFSSTLKTKYKMTNSNFSTVGSSDSEPVFPLCTFSCCQVQKQGKTLKEQR